MSSVQHKKHICVSSFCWFYIKKKKNTFTLQCSLAGASNLPSYWPKAEMLLQFLVFLATLKGSNFCIKLPLSNTF